MVFNPKNDTNSLFFFLLFPLKLELSYFKTKSISSSLCFTIYLYSIFHCYNSKIKHEIEFMENTFFKSEYGKFFHLYIFTGLS